MTCCFNLFYSEFHYPLSLVSCPLSIVHYQLSIINCPLFSITRSCSIIILCHKQLYLVKRN
ncbi:hypothetical protein F1649_07195 [Arcticibacter tournemirensis]|uniref:Uncharacterized protein n=1 Tax=Arcticibacter tournemirensis TaxID=699437 RepID=A0A5M9HBP1_9SPHI|nr:hypothetical protein F1649_07195 [Arcticibacter tournemirensis]